MNEHQAIDGSRHMDVISKISSMTMKIRPECRIANLQCRINVMSKVENIQEKLGFVHEKVRYLGRWLGT